MGILGGLLSAVAKLIDTVASKLPVINLDNNSFSSGVAFMNNLLDTVNIIFPVDVCGNILGILAIFFIAMLVFYFVQRLINLVRGSG